MRATMSRPWKKKKGRTYRSFERISRKKMKPVMYWGDTECLKGPRAARKAREDSAIAQRRVQLGMTQRQLADSLEIGVSAVRSWEQGTRQPGRASLIKLSEALHCTVDELLR